jgi:SNF2 family DNA or RNA helicase
MIVTVPGVPSTPHPSSPPDHCMAALPWGMVVVDESHNLRTTNARGTDAPHTEACVAAVKRAKRAVLLSGTPSLSRPYDLFRQVDALRPGLLGANKEAFAHRWAGQAAP